MSGHCAWEELDIFLFGFFYFPSWSNDIAFSSILRVFLELKKELNTKRVIKGGMAEGHRVLLAQPDAPILHISR